MELFIVNAGRRCSASVVCCMFVCFAGCAEKEPEPVFLEVRRIVQDVNYGHEIQDDTLIFSTKYGCWIDDAEAALVVDGVERDRAPLKKNETYVIDEMDELTLKATGLAPGIYEYTVTYEAEGEEPGTIGPKTTTFQIAQ